MVIIVFVMMCDYIMLVVIVIFGSIYGEKMIYILSMGSV